MFTPDVETRKLLVETRIESLAAAFSARSSAVSEGSAISPDVESKPRTESRRTEVRPRSNPA
jgi:hypothetical protein